MCGISGKVYFNDRKVRISDIKMMTDKIIYRGPDNEGHFISKDGKVGLGSRRLAIIDLSKKGSQPMCYKNRYWIVTNSEIYNFKDEKTKLKKVGYSFNSECDTEVILALYDRYKEKCLEHLNGMFAFCIFDSLEQKIFLARDRLGVKPLKYYLKDNVLIFSSEVKSILTQHEVNVKPDFESLQMYLLYGYIPSPYTGFTDINKLEPGHYILIDIKTKSIIKRKYWEPSFSQKLHLSEKEWCDKILERLEASTKIRLISDVPIGAYLSGGVDSSGVVAIMAALSHNPINTFTISFQDNKWDESKYARNIANIYKTNHIELQAKPIDTDIIEKASYHFEEPYSDAGAIVSFVVSELAKKHVTVVLNGDGGDENFAGYPNRHFRIQRDVKYDLLLSLVRPFSSIIPIKKITNFLEKSSLPLYKRFLSYNQIFSLDELKTITDGKLSNKYTDHILNPIKNIFENFKGLDVKDAALKFELMHWLPDDLLAKGDLMTMANSIEARSPFLDYNMVELAAKIPFELKTKNSEPKYILKKALEKLVPKENLYRPKRGFGIPLHSLFSGKLNIYTKKILLNKNSKINNIVNMNLVRKMLLEHSLKNDFGPKLWSLLTLELWLQNYF